MSEHEDTTDDVVEAGNDAVEVKETEIEEVKPVKKPKIRDEGNAILELRKENEKLRKSLDESARAQADVMAKEQAKTIRAEAKASAQKLVEEKLAEINERAKVQVTKAELRVHAERAGVVDFNDLYEIMKKKDLSAIEYDDEGGIVNAAEIISGLKKSKSHLFQGVSTSSTERVPAAKQAKEPEKIALSLHGEDYRKARHALNNL